MKIRMCVCVVNQAFSLSDGRVTPEDYNNKTPESVFRESKSPELKPYHLSVKCNVARR